LKNVFSKYIHGYLSIQDDFDIFAPIFLRCHSPDPAVILDTQKYQQTFVRHLMENEDSIFMLPLKTCLM